MYWNYKQFIRLRNGIVIRARRPLTLPRKRAEREVGIYDVQGGSEENQWVSVKGFQHAHACLSIKACVNRSSEFFGESTGHDGRFS